MSQFEKMSKSRGNVVTVEEVVWGVADLDPKYEFRNIHGNIIPYKEYGIWQNKLQPASYFTASRCGRTPVFLCQKDDKYPPRLLIDGKEYIQHLNYIKSLLTSKKRPDGQRVDGYHLMLIRNKKRKSRIVKIKKLTKINYLISEWIHLDSSSFGVENDYPKVKKLARYLEKLGIECYASKHYGNCCLAVRQGNEIEVYKRFNCHKNKRKYYLWYEQNIRSSGKTNV